jgi:Ni/Co efflux regulator RcnB
MKAKHLMIPALLAAFVASAPGFAQDRGNWSQNDRGNQADRGNWNQNDRGNSSQNDRGNWNQDNRANQSDRGNWNQDNRDRGGDRDRRDGYQARGGGRYGDEGYGGERRWDGAGPEHSWHRGDRLPSRYRSHQYVVDDWRGHHLRQPPRGYHWVQSGGDYVLAAIATGVIADLIINH